MSTFRPLWLIVLFSLGLGCQLKPTKISETADIDPAILVKNASGPIVIDENTVILDARSNFEYTVAHVPGSLNLTWEEFAQPRERYIGKTKSDLPELVKRLALLGLNPASKIIVVGSAAGGQGAEGRVAWSLIHMGFKNVQVVGIDYFRSGLNNAEPPPRANQPEWTPIAKKEMEADRSEVLAAATAKIPEGGRQTTYLIDVRTRKEYFNKHAFGEGYKTPDLRAIHIPWEQFYTSGGRPNLEIKNQILGLGIQPGDRIITLSHHGVRSGAAAFALMSLGFTNVANYTGGFQELLDAPKKPKGK